MIGSTKRLVTGERRSGTTLLANLLNAIEGLTVGRGLLHIARLSRAIAVNTCVASLTHGLENAPVRRFEGVATEPVIKHRQSVELLSLLTQGVRSEV